jgi:hypothetical protein
MQIYEKGFGIALQRTVGERLCHRNRARWLGHLRI